MSGRTHQASFIAAHPGVFVGLAAGAAAALLAAALFWEGDSAGRRRPKRIVDAVDVVSPAPLSEEETKRTSTSLDQERVALEAGAWVQVADEQGRLQQRYRAQRIDPEPDRWVRMERPHAVMYSGEDRVITMQADRGRARIPKRALQAGRLEGNVEIRAYRAPEGEKIRFDGDEPTIEPMMVILAEEAQFDEVLGEIRCDHAVELTAHQEQRRDGVLERTTIAFKGEGLSISVDSEQRTIERLVVERAVDPIVISREGGGELMPEVVLDGATAAEGAATGAAAGTSEPTAANSAEATNAATAARPGDASGATGVADAAGVAASVPAADGVGGGHPEPGAAGRTPIANAGAASAPAPSADFRPYRLTLHDNVVVRRIARGRESVVRGDRLVALFALEGQSLKRSLGASTPDAPVGATAAALTGGPAVSAAPATASRRPSAADLPSSGTRCEVADSLPPLEGSLESISIPPAARLTMLSIAARQQSTAASIAPQDAVDLITINYDGRLVMVPAPEVRSQLVNADDVVLSIEAQDVGARRHVELEDLRTQSRAKCERLVYRSAPDTIDLEGSVRQPLELHSPQLDLEGGAFTFQRRTGRGEVKGAGTMRLGDADDRAAGAGSGAKTEGTQSSRPGGSNPPSAASALPRDLEIVWSRGLDIELADEKSGRLKNARFQGDVKVDSTDFELATQNLSVHFAEKGENVVERIRAEGDSVATRLGEQGTLAAQIIDVTLAQDPEGRTIPKVMDARGRVSASDRNQQMWSRDLRVWFEPKTQAAPETTERREGMLGNQDLGNVEVTRVEAGSLDPLPATVAAAAGGDGAATNGGATTGTATTGGATTGGADATASADAAQEPHEGVQMLLRDGARVFAQKLDGDASKRRVELLGPDVMIVQKNLVADQLTHLLIDETARTVTANGPGRFRYFREPVTDATPSPRVRPDPQGKLSLDATWTERMKYDDRGNGGGGTIDLNGNVRVRAGRSDRERGALDAQTVQLDLRRDERRGAPTPGTAPESPSAPGSAPAPSSKGAFGSEFEGGVRNIQRLIAKGDAKLESMTWETDNRAVDPTQTFRVMGDHVEYDTITGEALVAGPGSLLVHDLGTNGGGNAAGMDARGTSTFKWQTSMDMKRLGSQRYLVTMKDGVQVLHGGLKPDDTLVVTCDQLETTLLRPGVGEDGGAGAGNRGAAARERGVEQGMVDLGGAAELQRVRAIGRVFVRAPDADIECDEFDYNTSTQMAEIKGREGRLAKVLRTGGSAPIQAASLLWDRRNGRITVQSGSGAVGR